MATADEVIVEFEARIGKYQADVNRAARTFEQATKAQREDMRGLEQQITRSSGQIGSSLKGLAATFAAAFSVRQIQQYADGYTRFTNQLRVAGQEGEGLAQTQERLFGIAQRYGIELESIGTLYSRTAQVSGELGASQEQLIQLSSGVAAALKIQGTSATEAQGALLQLSQALGSGTVRAEEFNSINEGALPILKAVAQNMDGVGGSVAKLKQLVNDGEVSSQAFFQAFLKGSADLEAQAAKKSLTIENSFTVLNNAIGKYVGETDNALSATERISQAIITLSENIDTVAQALAIIITVVGARYVAAVGSAAVATIAKAVADERAALAATAHAAAQARLNPLMLGAGASATVAAAGVSRLAVAQGLVARGASGIAALFGGPVGLAVAALAAGFIYLSTQTENAAEKTERFANEAETAKNKADELEGRLRAAGVKIDDVGDSAAEAKGKMEGFTTSIFGAISALQQLAQQKQLNALLDLGAQRVEIEREIKAARDDVGRSVGRSSAGGGYAGLGGTNATTSRKAEIEQRKKNIADLQEQDEALVRQMEAIATAMANGVDIIDDAVPQTLPSSGSAPSGSSSSRSTESSGPAPRTGPNAAELEEAYAADLARLQAEELQARIALTTDIDARADLQRELLALEKRERLRQIEEQAQRDLADVNADEVTTPEQKAELTRIIDQQKQAQIAIVDALYGRAQEIRNADGSITVNPAVGEYTKQVLEDLDEHIIRQKQDELSMQADALEAQANVERNIKVRNDLERQAIDIQHQIERSLLAQQIAHGEIADAARAEALLAQKQAAEQEALRQGQQSPFQQYISDLRDTQANMSLELESLGVDVLGTFNDRLTDAIVNFRSLGDVGRAALATLTEGLVKLAIQQILVNTLAKQFGQNTKDSGESVQGTAVQIGQLVAQQVALQAANSSIGAASAASTAAQAAAAAAAWAPAAALASLATLGANAGPAAAALATTAAISAGIAATSGAGFAEGGRIYGPGSPTSDSIPIRASRDEFMIKASAAKSIGYPALEFMNRTGEVPDVSTAAPKAAGFSLSASMDRGFKAEIRDAVAEAARTMPAINLYPTLSPAAALDAALSDPGGQRRLFDFFVQNSGAINSRLSGR